LPQNKIKEFISGYFVAAGKLLGMELGGILTGVRFRLTACAESRGISYHRGI